VFNAQLKLECGNLINVKTTESDTANIEMNVTSTIYGSQIAYILTALK